MSAASARLMLAGVAAAAAEATRRQNGISEETRKSDSIIWRIGGGSESVAAGMAASKAKCRIGNQWQRKASSEK